MQSQLVGLGTEKLCMDDELVMECQENSAGKALALSRSICIPPCWGAVAEVECAVGMKGKFYVQPSQYSSETIQMSIVNLLFMI